MGKIYKAHSSESTKQAPTVREHSENTAKLCRKGMLQRYSDISCQESIAEYYKRLFFMKQDGIQKDFIEEPL